MRLYLPYQVICQSCGGIFLGNNRRYFCTFKCRLTGRTARGMEYRRIRDIPKQELDKRRALYASNALAERLFLELVDSRLKETGRLKRRKESNREADRRYKAKRRFDNDLR
jgi:hypothetical protein